MALRAAVLGTGAWARRIHLPALAAHPRIELVGVWGRSGAAARSAADEVGVTAYDDVETLLSSVDLVSVAVTPDAQLELATQAARQGVHLLLEKPAAATAAGCRELSDVVRGAGVEASVFLSRLWDPARRAWLDRAATRDWRSIDYGWVSAGMRPESPGATGWRKEAGPLLDVGPHIVGLAEYLAGPIADVAATAAGGPGRVDFVFEHVRGCVTTSAVDLVAAVSSTHESLSLRDDAGSEHYANPAAVDFVGAYQAMLDDLIGRLADGRAASARGLASSLDRAVAMAEVLDEAGRRLQPEADQA